MFSFVVLAAIAIVLTGISLVAYGWIGDRPRGRLRCRRCWYATTDSAHTCSECGYKFRSSKDKRRTRRRWKALAAGVLTASIGGLTPTIATGLRDGWAAATPTVLLLSALPNLDPAGAFGAELLERSKRSGSWNDWQKRYAVNQAVRLIANKESTVRQVALSLQIIRFVKTAEQAIDVPTLQVHVNHPNSEIKKLIIETVIGCDLDAESASTVLVPLMEDEDRSVRLLAVKSYFFIHFTDSSYAALQRVAQADPDDYVREIASLIALEHRDKKLKRLK